MENEYIEKHNIIGIHTMFGMAVYNIGLWDDKKAYFIKTAVAITMIN